MATRLGNDVATFTGLEVVRSRPRTYIVEPDVEDIASDLARVYQMLIGESLAGAALSNIDPQAHDGVTGAALQWPLGSLQIGSGQTSVLLENKGITLPEIRCGSISANARRALWTVPLYVPEGHDEIVVHIRASSAFWTVFPTVVLLSPVDFSVVSDEVQPEPSPERTAASTGGFEDLIFRVPYDNAGTVPIVRLYAQDCVDNSTTHKIASGQWLPRAWSRATGRRGSLPPDAVASYSGGMTQPLRGSAWVDVWDTLTAAGRPLSSELLGKIADDLGLLFELATGAPAPGYATAATAGHNHDGSNSPVIGLPLLSVGLGWVPVSSAQGLGPSEGYYGAAPTIVDDADDDSYFDMCHAPAQMPERSSALTVNWGAVVYDVDGDGSDVRVLVGDEAGDTDTTSATQTTVGSGWHFVTGTVAADEGALQWFKWQVGQNKGKLDATTLVSLTGVCLWVTS